MNIALTHRLYLRIWLAVVAAVLFLTLVFGWIWRLDAERERAQRPAREIVLRDASGAIIGQGIVPAPHLPGQNLEFDVPLRNGESLRVQLQRPGNRPPVVPAPSWWRSPYSLLWLFGLVAVAVALGAYPIVRRLTKRLETLQQGVERWGQGDLSLRLPEDGRDEVAFLAQRFNIAAARVQALLLSHKALLANASHELRSPLARIRMGLELLQSQPNPAARAEITRNIHELDLLIDEILLASRLDAHPDGLGSMEPTELVALCAEEAARAEIELDVQTPSSSILVQGIPRLLRRALRNLLENARRHGAGHISLQLGIRGPQVVIQVCDQGPGVPPEFRERIFEPFFRLPGASERGGGAGLGLALVRSIAQRHGGTAHCEAPAGGGSCFLLTLPLSV